MPYDVVCTYQNIPIISLDARLRRGTSPGTFRIRLPHDSDLVVDANDLVFASDGGPITFRGCVPDLSTLRTEHRDGKREWVLTLRDRRATWPGYRISGRYNRRYRDNSIDGGTEMNAESIAALAMASVEESGLSSILPETYPGIDWNDTPSDQAINELLKFLPGHVCRDVDDKYSIRTTDQGDGMSTDWPAIIPDFLATIEGGPKKIRVKCNKTWFGAAMRLQAVGLDTDYTYKPIDQLSYTPANGWEHEWPTLFSGVQQFNRMRAFETVFRCYQVVAPQNLPFNESVYISDLSDLELDTHRVTFGASEPAPAYVTGTYYPWGDHPYNVADCPLVCCDFTIDKPNRLIRFEYPIFKIGNCIQPADLLLHTGFHLRDYDDGDWIRESFEIERDYGTGEFVLDIPYLWRARTLGYLNCQTVAEQDNRDDLHDEAKVYLDAWKDHFDTIREKRHLSIAGLHPVELNGKLAQVVYRLGRGQVPQTRVSMNFEART